MQKKLYRAIDEKMLGGVCAGIGNYFGIDKTIVRLVWAILAVCSISALFWVYIICWIVIPADDNIIDN